EFPGFAKETVFLATLANSPPPRLVGCVDEGGVFPDLGEGYFLVPEGNGVRVFKRVRHGLSPFCPIYKIENEPTETIKKAGVVSSIPPLPSISLGSAEVSPFELAESYVTLANLGQGCRLRPVTAVYDENGNNLWDSPLSKEARFSPYPTYQTVELMKGVFTNGTARAAQGSGINLDVFAGKTGTTNDFKDAWFVGFSPEILTLVWVGYDEEEKVGLTGAAAALPLWIEFIKTSEPFRQDTDFVKP
ncbi:MAG: hypothetical protein EBX50_21210, partial [Chitinophagia bacterium]|nr:hypothetical protein [Chitinophagia bacterium]